MEFVRFVRILSIRAGLFSFFRFFFIYLVMNKQKQKNEYTIYSHTDTHTRRKYKKMKEKNENMKCLQVNSQVNFFYINKHIENWKSFFSLFSPKPQSIYAIEAIVPNSKGRNPLVWSLIIIHFAYCRILSIVSFRTLRQPSSLDNTRVMGTHSEFRKRSDFAWSMHYAGSGCTVYLHSYSVRFTQSAIPLVKRKVNEILMHTHFATRFLSFGLTVFTRYRCAMICVESVSRWTLKCSHRSFASPNCV